MKSPNVCAAEADPLLRSREVGGSQISSLPWSPWTATTSGFLQAKLDFDLRSNIAAEARAKIVYERLITLTDDQEQSTSLHF